MADPTPQSQGTPDQPQDPNQPVPPTGAPKANEPVKRKRRRWPYVVGGIVLALLLLVLLAPTLAGIGPVRSMILNSVNDNLNGRVEVADWSIGWNSGITVNGLKLYEDKAKQKLILQASRVRTELSLIKALTSGFKEIALGRTDVDNLDLTNLHVDEKGELNLAKVAKESKQKTTKSEPPKISGDIHVNNLTGNVSAANVAQRLRINPSQIAVALTGLNDPIKNDVRLAFAVEDPAKAVVPGEITLKGDADVFDKGAVNWDTAKVTERVGIASVDLAALNPFLALAKLQLQTGGVANGTLDINVQGLANATANGEIKVASFTATGALLKGDQFRSNLTIPVKVTQVMSTKDAAVFKVDDLKIETDYGSVAVSADVAREALERLAKREPPGRDGHISILVDFTDAKKVAELVGSLRNTLSLSKDVKVDSAKLFAQVDAWLFADSVVTKTQLSVSEVAGSNKGARVSLEPITSTLDATYTPAGSAPFNIAQLKDVAIVLNSAFAQLNGGTGKGGTLTKFDLSGGGDLAKLQQQLAQFADLGKMKLAGTWTLKAGTQGDPANEAAPVATSAQFTATNLAIEGLGTLPRIVEPWLDLTAKGDLFLKNNTPTSLTNAVLALKSNNPQQPTVSVLAKGDVDLLKLTSKQFEFNVTASLAKAREEFAAIAGALNYFESGQLTASGVGSYDGANLVLSTERPATVKMTDLAVRKSTEAGAPVVLRGQSLDAVLAGIVHVGGDQTGADIKAFSIVAPKLLEVKKKEGDLKVALVSATKKLSGTGGVTVWADFKRLGDLAKSFAPPAEGTETKDATVAELTRGILDGAVTFTTGGQAGTTLAGDFTADVGVKTAKGPIDEKLVITLKGIMPDELTREIQANVDVKGKVLNASLANGRLLVAQPKPGGGTTTNGLLDMLRAAKITVTADRLELVQAILDSLMPAATASNGGAAAITASAVEPPAAHTAPRGAVSGNERISSPAGRATVAAARQPEPADDEIDGEVEKALPPIKIVGGKLTLGADIVRNGRVTEFGATLNVDQLSMLRGIGTYQSKDGKIALNVKGKVESTAPSNTPATTAPSLLETIASVRLDDVSGDLDVGNLKTRKPIVITNLASASPRMEGGIELEGSLAVLLRALEFMQAVKPGSKYPYTGYYVLAQQVATQGDFTQFVGSLKASKFKAYNPDNHKDAIFSEDLITITNDVAADTKSDTLTVKDLSFNMQSTGALALSLSNGQLADWANERRIVDKLQAKLKIDWPKLWTIVKPSLSPDTQKSLADLELAGVMERAFRVEGSFPTTGTNKRGERITLNTAQSLKFLKAYGGLYFDRVALSGIDVRKADLPVSLEKGVLYLQDATKPKGQRYPEPFACNDGQIDLGGVQVSLLHTDATGAIVPWITIPDKNKVLMRNVAFNPLLAGSTIGNYVNPGFSGAQDARGRVTVTSAECRDIPLDWFTASKKEGSAARAKGIPPSKSDGRAEFLVAISQMELQAPLLSVLFKSNKLTGEVKSGRISVENGIVKSDLPMELNKGQMTLAWSGAVNLHDRHILNFNTAIPKQLLGNIPGVAQYERYMPAVLNVPISGSFDAPKVDLLGAVTKSLIPGGTGRPEDLLKGLPDLLGGGKKDKEKPRGDQPGQPRSSTDGNRDLHGDRAADVSNDPVGGLVDLAGGLLGGGKKKDEHSQHGMRDIGNERISSDPAAVIKPPPVATTTPATQRTVSGKTKALRAKEQQDPPPPVDK